MRLPRSSVKIFIGTSSEDKKSVLPSKRPKITSKSNITVLVAVADTLQKKNTSLTADGFSFARVWGNHKPINYTIFLPRSVPAN